MIGSAQLSSNPRAALDTAKKLLGICDNLDTPAQEARALCTAAQAYLALKENNNAFAEAAKAIKRSRLAKDKLTEGNSQLVLSKASLNLGSREDGLFAAKRAQKIFKDLG